MSREPPSSWRARKSTAIRTAVAVAILAALIYQAGVRDLRLQLENASLGWWAAALAMVLLERYGRCHNWSQLLQALGVRAERLRQRALQLYFAGGFLGTVVPSTASTDAIRTVLAQRAFGGCLSRHAASVVMLNVISWVVGCLMGLLGLALLTLQGHTLRLAPLAAALFAAVIISSCALYAMLKFHRGRLFGILRRFHPRWFGLRGKIRRFLDSLLIFERAHVRFMPIFLTALAVQLVSALGLALTAESVQVSLPTSAYLVAMPLVAVVSLLPASVLGFGATQAALVYYLSHFGIGASTSLALSTLHSLIALGIHVTLGAAAFAYKGGADAGAIEPLQRIAPATAPDGDAEGNAKVPIELIDIPDAGEQHQWQLQLLEFTHDAIIIWEMDGAGILYWNRAAEQLYGYSRQEAYGKITHMLLQTEAVGGGVSELESKLARYGIWVGELSHTARGGQKISVESRLALMPQQHGRWLVLEVNRDITDRGKAARTQRATEQRLFDLRSRVQ